MLRPNTIALIIIMIWLLITFIFSFLEKITALSETKSFFITHFKASFIRSFTTPLLYILLILELVVVFLLSFGLYQYLLLNETFFLLLGLIVTSFSLLSMLIGQRIAKDYQGATSLTVYMIITIIGFCLLQ